MVQLIVKTINLKTIIVGGDAVSLVSNHDGNIEIHKPNGDYLYIYRPKVVFDNFNRPFTSITIDGYLFFDPTYHRIVVRL